MVTKAVFIDYSWKRKRIGLTKCKDVSSCLLCSWGDGQQGAFSSGGRKRVVVSMPTHPSQSVHTFQSICTHIPVSLPTHPSQYAHTRQRILRRKATGTVPYTLLYIVFSGAFQRLLPRLLYWLSYVFLTSPSQDSTFAMSIGRKGETNGCDNGNQPLPFDCFVN